MVTQMPKNPVGNTASAVNGGYLQLGIIVGRLYNLGESSVKILSVVRTALAQAGKDGVGQEAR